MLLTTSLLEQALAHYQSGDLAAAESLLQRQPDHPSALHLLGLVRVRQGRIQDAVDLLSRSVAVRPGEAQSQFNYDRVLATLGRHAEAADAFEAALKADAAHRDAVLALARSRHALGQLNEAIECYGRFLEMRPDHIPAKTALADALIAASRPGESVTLLTRALDETKDPRLSADLHHGLAVAHRKQLNYAEAFRHLEQGARLDPARGWLAEDRAGLLEAMHRFQEARSAYEEILEREPANAKIHRGYNDLLYRLGVEDGFLISYERAPRTKELLLDKAQFLLSAGRWEDAESCFRNALSRYGDDKIATLGLGLSLLKGDRIADSVTILEDAARQYPDEVDVHCNLAGAFARLGDGEKGVAAAKRALDIAPYNQVALAMLGTCLRLIGEGGDESLNGYDEFIRIFDLEPPDGFSDMVSFNAELMVQLNGMHPKTREYLRQSLRGGTQTSDNLFDSSRLLIEKLRLRIEEAVAKYISGLKESRDHPLLSRRGKGFRFTGSWSSRLYSDGFHINHLHPGGWISSCYYVEVPNAAADRSARQGWIKFGEPSFDAGLAARHSIRPVPGRLILFPSYMWHGTQPFHDDCSRTTIAFDVVPTV